MEETIVYRLYHDRMGWYSGRGNFSSDEKRGKIYLRKGSAHAARTAIHDYSITVDGHGIPKYDSDGERICDKHLAYAIPYRLTILLNQVDKSDNDKKR